MSKEVFKDQWEDIKDQIQDKWSQFTEKDLNKIAGDKDEFLKSLQEKYYLTAEKAKEEWENFSNKMAKKMNNGAKEFSATVSDSVNSMHKSIKKAPLTAMGIAALVGLMIGLRF